MTRNTYFSHLLDLFSSHIEATDPRTEYELQEKILSFIEENNVPSHDEENIFESEDNG